MSLTGYLLLDNPMLNKGSAFSQEERREFGLLGLLPPHTSTMDEQLARVYENYRRKETDSVLLFVDKRPAVRLTLVNQQVAARVGSVRKVPP